MPTKSEVQRKLLSWIIDTKKNDMEIASMEWNRMTNDDVQVWHTCDAHPGEEYSEHYYNGWKQSQNIFRSQGTGEALKLRRGQLFGKSWYGLVLQYREGTHAASIYAGIDYCSALLLADEEDAVFASKPPGLRIIWFSRKTNRNRYIKYMNAGLPEHRHSD